MSDLVLESSRVAEPAPTTEMYGRRMATGSLLTGIVRASVIPLGVVAAVALARGLGPNAFGVFAVASSLVWWAQQTVNAFFNRTAIKLIAESPESQPLATALIQLQFLAGLGVSALLFFGALLLAVVLNAPLLAEALRWFALAVPIFSLTQAHENAVIGQRAFHRSAFFPLFFNGSRSLFILLFIAAGWGLPGAILAQLGAALVELTYARFSFHPALWRRVSFPLRRIARYSAPMFLDGLGRQLNPRIDLWSVQAFVGATTAGYYSAAQSALSPLSSVSQILSPLLLATLTHARQRGEDDAARAIAGHALRLLFCLLPFVALFAGASRALVTLVFGQAFADAAPLLAWLSFGAFANFVLAFTAVTLAALDRPGTIVLFTLPMLVASAVGSLLLVPRIGALGAATTTVATQWGAMAASLWLLERRAHLAPEVTVFFRVVSIATLAFIAANLAHAPGWWLVPFLAGASALVLLALIAARLITREDIQFALSLAHPPRQLVPRARFSGAEN